MREVAVYLEDEMHYKTWYWRHSIGDSERQCIVTWRRGQSTYFVKVPKHIKILTQFLKVIPLMALKSCNFTDIFVYYLSSVKYWAYIFLLIVLFKLFYLCLYRIYELFLTPDPVVCSSPRIPTSCGTIMRYTMLSHLNLVHLLSFNESYLNKYDPSIHFRMPLIILRCKCFALFSLKKNLLHGKTEIAAYM